MERKLLLSLSLASASYLKWQKVLKFQRGTLLNKQERCLENPPLSVKINPAVASPAMSAVPTLAFGEGLYSGSFLMTILGLL